LRISLFGVGYVGSVSAACLVRDGHEVIAVDINPEKIDALNRGRAPIVEPGLDALIEAGVGGGRLRGSMNAAEAVRSSEISIVCVGTPSAPDGSLDLSAVKRVATVIGGALAHKSGFHVVAVRSTLAIGTMMRLIAPLMERVSGRTAGTDFGLAYYPEFLREGSAIRDYDEPSQSVIAVTDPETFARLLAIPSHAAPPPIVLSFEEAEAIKSAHNAWHALKVSFANEMGGLLSAEGVDSHRVMETFCRDQRLNLSPAYLIPGFAFGGSCLPKDVRALRALGRRTGRPTPLLQGGDRSRPRAGAAQAEAPRVDHRPGVQAGRRRPEGKSLSDVGRAVDRPGLRRAAVRSRTSSGPAGRRKPRLRDGALTRPGHALLPDAGSGDTAWRNAGVGPCRYRRRCAGFGVDEPADRRSGARAAGSSNVGTLLRPFLVTTLQHDADARDKRLAL
jgi:nucleotide sugar dehydrogenase